MDARMFLGLVLFLVDGEGYDLHTVGMNMRGLGYEYPHKPGEYNIEMF